MNEFEDRLRAADPAAASAYQHPDSDAMITRIMARAPRARRHVLRSFQLRMAGSVAFAAALTVGGIAALDGASPSLSVFALAPTSQGHRAAVSKTPNAFGAVNAGTKMMPMRILEEFNFTAGPDLSADAGSGPAYQLQFPTSASAEASRVATIFGVAGSPVDVNNDGQDFTVTDPSGNYVEYQSYDTVPQWTYSIATPQAATYSTSDGTTAAMPSHATFEGDVQGFLNRLGYGFQVTDPQYSTSNTVMASSGQPSVTTNVEQASYSVTVDGQMTDQYFDFAVDQNNQVVSASGPAFSVAPAVNYPLQSPAAGVGVLEAQQQSEFASSGSSVQPSGVGSSTGPNTAAGSPSTPPSPADSTDTTTTTIPITDVTLDAETVSYQTYELADGSVWMLPIYNYTGNVTNADGSSYTGTWSTIAVDPTFIQVPASGGLNPGGPIMY